MNVIRNQNVAVVGWCVAALLYCGLMTHVASLWPKTTDQTSYFLAGVDVAHGNWRLRGWSLTPPDFWTSDIALSALLSGVWRLLGRPPASPVLLMVQPAILWTGLVASALYLVRTRLPSLGAKLGGTLVVLTLLAVPLMRVEPAYFITLSAIHIGSVIYAVWVFHWAERFVATRSTRCLSLMGGLLWLGVLGDPLLQVVATLPLLLWSVLGVAQANIRTRLAGVTLLAALLAPVTLALNAATGGFTTPSLDARFSAWDALLPHVSLVAHCILLAFTADPFGQAVGRVMPELIRLVFVIACAVGVYRVLVPGQRAVQGQTGRSTAMTPFVMLLLFAAGCDALSLIVSDRIELEGNSIAAVRYLFPLWADLAIVAALLCARHAGVVGLAGLALILTLDADKPLLTRPSTGVLSQDDSRLLASLLREEPAQGIGTWWSSGNLGLASLGRLTLLPGIRNPDGRIEPFVHIHPAFSFEPLKGQPFFVLVPQPTETYSEADVLRTFGAPRSRRQEGRFLILRYGP